jgi:hypothetical protein
MNLLILEHEEIIEEEDELSLLLLERENMSIRTIYDLTTASLPPPDQSSWSYVWNYGDDASLVNIIGKNQ